MSNWMKVLFLLSGRRLNHSITLAVFFHWLYPVFRRIWLLILSSIFLLITPISLLAGLISLHVGLVSKLALWSFRVIKGSFFANTSMRSASSSLSAISLPSKSISFFVFAAAFLYVFVTLSSTILLYDFFGTTYILFDLSPCTSTPSEELISFTSFMSSFWKESTWFLNFMLDIKLYMAFSNEVSESFGSGNLAVLNPYVSFSLLEPFLLSWCIAVHLSRLANFSHCSIRFFVNVHLLASGMFFIEYLHSFRSMVFMDTGIMQTEGARPVQLGAYQMYMWQMSSVFSHESAQRNDGEGNHHARQKIPSIPWWCNLDQERWFWFRCYHGVIWWRRGVWTRRPVHVASSFTTVRYWFRRTLQGRWSHRPNTIQEASR